MSKSILLALLTVTSSTVCIEETFACGRGSGCAMSNHQMSTSCAAPATGMSSAAPANGTAPSAPAADPHAGMNMTQANKGTSYQSFSYEPGSSQPTVALPAPTYRTSVPMMRQPSRSFYDSVRGDRKVRGLN